MPELPEVETMRRGIAPLAGRRIARVWWPRCRLKPLRVVPARRSVSRRIAGRMIVDVGRVGKRVLLRLDSDESLVFEPRMTGLVLLADPPDREHLRMAIEVAGRPSVRLLFWDRRGLGSVQLLGAEDLQREFGPAKIGPDALGIAADQLRDRLRSSRREIKVALLDQRAVAGVGNLYASELLHVAGVHPQTRCDRLSRRQWTAIHGALRAVLEEAIRYEGSTLSDGTYRNALNRAGGYQNHHRVYSRAGRLCPSCGRGAVVRIVQGQRSTFFCPLCQKRRGRTNGGE